MNKAKQHRKLKRRATRTPPKNGSELRCLRKVSSSCILQDTQHKAQRIKVCWTPLYTQTNTNNINKT